jgi:hypothetical protein
MFIALPLSHTVQILLDSIEPVFIDCSVALSADRDPGIARFIPIFVNFVFLVFDFVAT